LDFSNFILFIGNYSSNESGNFAKQIVNIFKSLFESAVIDESYTSTVPALCNHGISLDGEICHHLEHSVTNYRGKSYFNWDSLQCTFCHMQCNRDIAGSRNIAIKGAMLYKYKFHIYPTRKPEKQNNELKF